MNPKPRKEQIEICQQTNTELNVKETEEIAISTDVCKKDSAICPLTNTDQLKRETEEIAISAEICEKDNVVCPLTKTDLYKKDFECFSFKAYDICSAITNWQCEQEDSDEELTDKVMEMERQIVKLNEQEAANEKDFKYKKKTFPKRNILHAKLHIKYLRTKEIAETADRHFTRGILDNLAGFKRAADYFIKRMAHLIALNEGCVECVLMFDAAEKLQSFWTEYKSGDLSKLLTHEYITQELEEMEGEEMLYVDVYICEQELATAWDFFTKPGEPETKTNIELPSTSGTQIKQERPLTFEQNIKVELGTVHYQNSYHIMKSEKETAAMCLAWGSIFAHISPRVSCMWKELALHLKLTEEDTQAIVSQHPNEEEAQCLECLETFLERNNDQPVEQITAQLLTALYMMHLPTFAETVADLLTMEGLPVCHELIQRPVVCDTLSSDVKDYEKYNSGEDSGSGNDSDCNETCLQKTRNLSKDGEESQKDKTCHSPFTDRERWRKKENSADEYGEVNCYEAEVDSKVDETVESLNSEPSLENEESLHVVKLQYLLPSETTPADKRPVEDIVKLLELFPELFTKLKQDEQKKLASTLLCVGCDTNANARVCRNLKQRIFKLASPKHKAFASLLKTELLDLLHNVEGDNTLHLSENWKLLSQTPKKELKTWQIIADIFTKQLSKNERKKTKILKILARNTTLLKFVLQKIEVGLADDNLLFDNYQRPDLHTNINSSKCNEPKKVLVSYKRGSEKVLKQLYQTRKSRTLSAVERTLFLNVLSLHAEVHGGCYSAAEGNAVILLQYFLTCNGTSASEQSKCMVILAKDVWTSNEILKQLHQTHTTRTLSAVEKTLFLIVLSQHAEVHGSFYSAAEKNALILLQYFLTNNGCTNSEQSECLKILANEEWISEEVIKQLYQTHNSRTLSALEKACFLHVLSQHTKVHGHCSAVEGNTVVLLHYFLTNNDCMYTEQSECMQILAKDRWTSEEVLKQLDKIYKSRALSAVEKKSFLNVLSQHAEVHGRCYSAAKGNAAILLKNFLTKNDILDSEKSKCMKILSNDECTSEEVLTQLCQSHYSRTLTAVERASFLNVLSQHAEVHGRCYSAANRNAVILLQYLTSNDITDLEKSKCMHILAKDEWISEKVLKQLYQTHKSRTLSAVERTMFLDVLSQYVEVHGRCYSAKEENAVILLQYFLTSNDITDLEKSECMKILAKDKCTSEEVLQQIHQTHTTRTLSAVERTLFLKVLSQHAEVHGTCYSDAKRNAVILLQYLTSNDITDLEKSECMKMLAKDKCTSQKVLQQIHQTHTTRTLSAVERTLFLEVMSQHVEVHGSCYSAEEGNAVNMLQYFLTSDGITDSEQLKCMHILAKDE